MRVRYGAHRALPAMNEAEDVKKKSGVVIVDGSPLFREALAGLLHADSDFGNVAETGDKQLGMFYMDRLQPDLVIVDMHMKKGAAIELLRYAKNLPKSVRVIMMTDRDDSEELMATVQLQAEGYLSKLIEVPELLSQIKRVVGGKVVVSNRLMAALTRAFREDTGEVDRDLNCLTSREKDVLKCLSIGMSNQQTGEYLSIQLGTVKVHVKHILKKMGFASRTQAALWARDRGVTI